jgi:colicin import membrane protein
VAKREHACLETVCVLGHYCAVDPQTKHCVCVERSPYLETPEGQAEAAVKAAAEAAAKVEEKAEKAAAEAESKAEERAQKHAAETHAKALEVAAKHAAEASAKILERKTKSDAEASAKSEASSKALALKAAVKANAAEAAAKSAERSSKAAAVAMFGDSRRRYVAPVFGDSRRRYVAPVFGDSRRRYVAPVKTKSSGGGTGAPSNGGGCRRLMEASAGLRRRLIDAKNVWGSKGIHHASGTQMMCRRLREQMCTPNGAWAGTPACE